MHGETTQQTWRGGLGRGRSLVWQGRGRWWILLNRGDAGGTCRLLGRARKCTPGREEADSRDPGTQEVPAASGERRRELLKNSVFWEKRRDPGAELGQRRKEHNVTQAEVDGDPGGARMPCQLQLRHQANQFWKRPTED